MMRSSIGLCRLMKGKCQSSPSSVRYLSDGKGRVLSEEELAKETVYIQKLEREKQEKLKKKEKEKAAADKEKADQAAEGNKKS